MQFGTIVDLRDHTRIGFGLFPVSVGEAAVFVGKISEGWRSNAPAKRPPRSIFARDLPI